MSKIKIHSTLTSPEGIKDNEIIGFMQDDKIIYKEDNIDVTIILFDNKIELNRKSKEYNINMSFVKNEEISGSYIVDNKIIIDLKVKTNILEIKPNKIIIEYELKVDDELVGIFNWEISYEVISWI